MDVLNLNSILPWPSFKGGHSEESEHGLRYVVKVEGVSLPRSLLHHGLGYVPVVVDNELTSEWAGREVV